MSQHFQTYNIKHITISVYSPWVGRPTIWETLLCIVKNCVRKNLDQAKMAILICSSYYKCNVNKSADANDIPRH